MDISGLRRIGGFDARFFPGNYEDDDYCMRLLAGGLVPYLADDVFIHHEGSKSFALEPTSYRALLEANWGRFKEKWGLPDDRPIERYADIRVALLDAEPGRKVQVEVARKRVIGADERLTLEVELR